MPGHLMLRILPAVICALLLSGGFVQGCRPEPCTGDVLLAREIEVYSVVLGQITREKGRVLSSRTERPYLRAFTDFGVPLADAPMPELQREFSTRSAPACLAPLGTMLDLKVSSGSADGLIALSRIAFSGEWAYCQAFVSGGEWFARQGFLLNRTPSGWKLQSVHFLEMS
jgi:hypothetical protein